MPLNDRCYHRRWHWKINGMTLFLLRCTTATRLRSRIYASCNTLQGKYGLLVDALQSVRMVGADGKVRIVSATSHPDLWWGVLGAGANFGVVTSATYKVHPLVNNGDVFLADFFLPASRSREYFDMVETHYSNASANVAQIVIGSWNRTTNSVSHALYPARR